MIKYLHKIIDESLEVIHSTSDTYTTEHLFMVQDKKDTKLLPEEQAQNLHNNVVHLLFICSIDRPDIHPLVDFLTTRVSSPDEDDWGNLK